MSFLEYLQVLTPVLTVKYSPAVTTATSTSVALLNLTSEPLCGQGGGGGGGGGRE